jgi:hypothetical protein
VKRNLPLFCELLHHCAMERATSLSLCSIIVLRPSPSKLTIQVNHEFPRLMVLKDANSSQAAAALKVKSASPLGTTPQLTIEPEPLSRPS